MSSEDVSATENESTAEDALAAQPQPQEERRGFGAMLRRHPALWGLMLVLFCAVMLAYEIVAPSLFTSRIDEYATLIPRFSDFVVMVDVEAIEASPAYADLNDSVKRQLQLYPDELAEAGIDVGEGNRLRRILIAGKSQSRVSLVSFIFDKPVTFNDRVAGWLHRREFHDYEIWLGIRPDGPVCFYADRSSGLLMVSSQQAEVTAAIERREQAAGFRLYKEVAEWTSLLEGDEPVWCAFSELRAYRGEEEDNGRTFAGLVAAPRRRVPVAGGAARITLGDDLAVQETLVFKTEVQASEYVQQRRDLAGELPDGEVTASWAVGDRMLAIQEIEQAGRTVTVKQSLPLNALDDLLNGWPASESMYRLFVQ